MFSYSDFETDVATMIAYASQPTDPAFIAQPSNTDLEQGVAPLETLPAQWWNWLMNQFTTKFNYVRTYVDNIMKEITGVLTLVDLSADDTDSQLSNVFANLYPNYLSEFVHTIATSYVETTGHTYAVAVYDNDGNGDYKTTKASALPVLVGGTGASTDQGGLENLCASIPAAVSSQSTDEVMFKDGTNVKKVTLADMAPQIYQLIKNNIEADSLYTRFQMPFVSSEAIGTAKTVDFPAGYTPSTDPDHAKLVFKVLFLNGHNTLGTLDYMTLNGLPIVVYQNGTLVNIPIHTMDDNGTTVYKVLDPNVMLDLYYTADWDGNGTAGWIVAGNPEVLKSTDYTIYADGLIEQIMQGNEVALRTFPVSFNTTDYYGYIFVRQANNAQYPTFLSFGTKEKNQAQLYRSYHNGAGTGYYNVAIPSDFWIKLMGY